MVDQIRAWLDLIPEGERKRWSWLLDQNESTFGMPRMVDTPVGRVYNPLAYPGDVAGALGTAISDPIKENVLQPATGALFHAANRLPGGARKPFTSEAEVPLEEYTPEGLRRYLKANTEGSFLGELSAGILSDPLTFVGGPIGRVARGVEALPLLNRVPGVARGAGAVAAADEAYVRAMGSLIEGGLARTGEFAKTLPVVGKLFQDSPQKALTAFEIESQRAERAASQALRSRGLNWRDIVEPPRMDVKGTAREWESAIKPTFTQFDEEVAGLAHPAQQVEMLRLRQQAAETENLLNTRGEQSRIAVMEGMAEGDITPKLGEAQIRKSWQSQQKGVRALQIGLFDALDAVKAAAPDTLGAVDDPTRAAITSQISDVTGAIRGFHDDASQVGLSLRGGLSPEEGDRITGIFNMKDPQQRIMAMQAQDLAYRGAYDKTVARLDQTVFDLEKKYGDLFDADSVAAVRQTLDDTFRATQDALAPATQPIEQTLRGLGGDHLQTIMDLWQGAPLGLPKALNRVLSVRDRIAGEAEPLIRRWYEEAYSFKNRGQTLSAAEIDQRVERALSSATYLMRDPALLDPANAAARKQIAGLITKYAPGGDILNPDHTGRIAMNLLVKPKAAELGITSTPPWFSPMSIMLGAWKELALMSPRFHFANVISQLLLSEADGVSSGRIATMQARKLRTLARTGRVDDVFDATVSPTYAAVRDTGDVVELAPGVTGNASDATMLPGGRGADTNLGRIPIAIRAGVPALATGGAAFAATPNDEDRNRNALVGALLGGSFGAAAPRFARANRLLAQVTETGARGAAFLTGVEEALGTLVAGGKGKGLLQQVHDQIPELLSEVSMPVVGKRVTPLGETSLLPPLERPPLRPQPSPRAVPADDLLVTEGGTPPAWTMTREQFGAQHPPDAQMTAAEQAAQGAEWLAKQRDWQKGPGLQRMETPDGWASVFYNDKDGNAIAMAYLEGVGPGKSPYVSAIAIDKTRGLLSARASKAVLDEVATFGPLRLRDTTSPEAADLLHRAVVERAVAQGKPVPPEVLAEYPRLGRQVATAAAPARPVAPPPPLRGNETLTTMQDLYAPGRTLRGTPQIAVQTGERLGAATTIGQDVDVAAVQRAFANAGGKMSPDALADLARKAGATEEQALRLRAGFDEAISQAETIGTARSNKINFDYSDVNNSVQWLRDSGVAPFSVWSSKAMPVYTKIMLQHPGLIVAINELNDLSDDDIQEAGLTGKFARMAHLGELGTFLAEQVLGRADGTVMSNVLGAVFPYSEVGVDRNLGPDANPLEQGLAALQGVGLGPSPLVTLPLMAAGATDELPPSLFRTSAYLGAGTQALTGVEADPEMLTKRIMRGARTLTGAPVEPTVTGDFLKDRAIRQRIAELSVEATGAPPAGPYLLAMDDPASNIWQLAQSQVERQRTGQTLLGAIVPAKTKFLSDTEAEVRRIREETGVGPTESAARRAQPATAAELASAELAARKKPLTPGETLAERAATARYYAAEDAAAGINPLAKTLNNLGGNQALARQYPEWQAFLRRTKHMPPKRRGQLTAEFLGQRPQLREWVATHNLYG